MEENFRKYGLPVEENNIQLIKGLFQNTLHVEQKVALAHIDGDWYESVLTCLNRIAPHLTPGGVLVIDVMPGSATPWWPEIEHKTPGYELDALSPMGFRRCTVIFKFFYFIRLSRILFYLFFL